MQCRTCYMARLTPDEVARFVSEPLTHPIYMCPEHQASFDLLTKGIAHLLVKSPRPRDWQFPEVAHQEE